MSILQINHSFAQTARYHPSQIKNDIILDGKLSDPEWLTAEVEGDFMQYDPIAGLEPSEKTEIRILYNSTYLYVGLRAYDHLPKQLVGYSLQRDFEEANDDGFALVIDMYNDKSTGLSFISNLLDARWDAELYNDGSDYNVAYNTFWDAASSIDSLGYSTEYRIPFSSLRFEPRDTVVMGFRVVRLIKRLNEFDIFPRCDPQVQYAYFRVSLAREMEFYYLKSKKPFYIMPYAIANYSVQNLLNSSGTAYNKLREVISRKKIIENETADKILSNLGFDIKYGLSKNITLDITANTDFAQAEADNVIVNLTKFEVNLPEKRNFFLESQTYFTYTSVTGNEIFISRSIGLENDQAVPIIGGARITAKTHGWQTGVLDMQTKSVGPNISSHNFFVFRTRKEIDQRGSYIGGIVTNLLNTQKHKTSSQSFGLDLVNRFNERTTWNFSIAATTTNGTFKNVGRAMDVNTSYSRNVKEGYYFSLSTDWIGSNFSPAMGFVQENDLFYSSAFAGFRWKGSEDDKKAYYYLQGNTTYKYKPDLKKEETRFVSAQVGMSFKSGASIDITPLEWWNDKVFTDWHISDHITIPAGTYKMYSPSISIITPQKSKYRGGTNINLFDLYGGKRISIQPYFSYIFNKHLSTSIEYQHDRIKFPASFSDNGNGLFVSNLLRISLSYYFNARLSIKLLSQYDQANYSINSNFRFRYNPTEGTNLYIVLNQGLNRDVDRLSPKLPLVDKQAVIVKFIKTFIF